MLPVSGLFLAATLVSNLLLGIFVNIAMVCARVFYQKIKDRQVNYVHLGSFTIITILCCIKVVMDNVITVQAHTNIVDGQATYPSLGSTTLVTITALWVVETLVPDAFIIYRVWIVYSRKLLVIIAPCILLLGCLAAGIMNLLYLGSSVNGDGTQLAELSKRTNTAAIAFASTTLALNALCTGLISYRIWRVRSDVANFGGTRTIGQDVHRDPTKRIVAIVIESAAIYTVVLLLYIAFLAADSNLALMVVPIISPLIAVVFGSIIVRSARGVAVGQTSAVDAKNRSTSAGVYEMRSGRGAGDERVPKHPIGGLQVSLNTVVTSKVDGEESEGAPYGDINASGETKAGLGW